MSEFEPECTPQGTHRKPEYELVAEFCSNALKVVNRYELVKNAFECCGLVSLAGIERIEGFFTDCNLRLRCVIYPDPTNVSRENLVTLARVDATFQIP